MGAYTWTFIRIDKVNDDMAKRLVEKAKHSLQHTTYGDYSKKSWNAAVKDWLDMHKEDYDFFVNECGVDPSKLTDDYLINELKQNMDNYYHKIECYDKFFKSEMTFIEVLNELNQLKYYNKLNDFYIIKRKGNYYVNIDTEVFRNYEYCEKEFHTVKSLIDHCRKSGKKNFIDYKDGYDFQEWDDKIEKNVKEFYEAIGDDNFYVHFG